MRESTVPPAFPPDFSPPYHPHEHSCKGQPPPPRTNHAASVSSPTRIYPALRHVRMGYLRSDPPEQIPSSSGRIHQRWGASLRRQKEDAPRQDGDAGPLASRRSPVIPASDGQRQPGGHPAHILRLGDSMVRPIGMRSAGPQATILSRLHVRKRDCRQPLTRRSGAVNGLWLWRANGCAGRSTLCSGKGPIGDRTELTDGCSKKNMTCGRRRPSVAGRTHAARGLALPGASPLAPRRTKHDRLSPGETPPTVGAWPSARASKSPRRLLHRKCLQAPLRN